MAMIELCANQQVTKYRATLTSIRSTQASYRLSIRDVRLLRSSTPVLQLRAGYIIFNFGDLQGVLQHDRLTIINAERPNVKALADEIQKRLLTDRESREEAPFEVSVWRGAKRAREEYSLSARLCVCVCERERASETLFESVRKCVLCCAEL